MQWPCRAPREDREQGLKSILDLPAEDYQEVRIVDPHLKGERPEDKEGILDVKVKTPSGNQRTED